MTHVYLFVLLQNVLSRLILLMLFIIFFANLGCKPKQNTSSLSRTTAMTLEACDSTCQKSLDTAVGDFENAGRAWIGMGSSGPMDMSDSASSKSLNAAFLSDSEASKLRWALMGAVREYLNWQGKSKDIKAGEPITYPNSGKKNWGSVFYFDGCEGNKLQGSKDASKKAIEQCAKFLLDESKGVNYRLLIFGNHQVVYATPRGVDFSNMKNGAAFFSAKSPLPRLSFLTVKPTASKAFSFAEPIDTTHGFDSHQVATLEKAFLSKDIKNLSNLSESWFEDRKKKVALIGEGISLAGGVALTALTFGTAGPAVAGSAATTGASIFAVIGGIAGVAGIAADLASITRVNDRIELIKDPKRKNMFRAAMVVLQIASMADLSELAVNTIRNPKRVAAALGAAIQFTISAKIMKKNPAKAAEILSDPKVKQLILNASNEATEKIGDHSKDLAKAKKSTKELIEEALDEADEIGETLAKGKDQVENPKIKVKFRNPLEYNTSNQTKMLLEKLREMKNPAFHWKVEDLTPVSLGGNQVLLSPILQNGRKGGKGRKHAIMFIQGKTGKMESRLLYKSGSDGGWRVSPYIDSKGRYSKGMGIHYTQETKLDRRILYKLERADETKTIAYTAQDSDEFNLFDFFEKEWLKSDDYFKNSYTYKNEVQVYHSKLLEPLQECKPGHCFKVVEEGGIKNWRNSIAKINWDSSEMKRFVPDFSGKPRLTYKMEHTNLGQTNVEVFTGTLNGKKVDWHMARDSDNRVWIDRIQFKDCRITSYGTCGDVLDTGILTNKPLEYIQQSQLLDDSLKQFHSSGYMDISKFLMELEPIKRYREARL